MTIADNLQTLIDCKADMKSAIEEKGVTVSGGLSTYADAIRSIEQPEEGGLLLPDGIKFAYSTVSEFPLYDTSNHTDMERMFLGCNNLLFVPNFNTSNTKNMAKFCWSCSKLISIPNLDTSNVQDMSDMFFECYELESLPLLDTTCVKNMYGFFSYEYTAGSGRYFEKLTSLGGFKNLGAAYSIPPIGDHLKGYGFLYRCPNLTHESVMNVINNLYDQNAAGKTDFTLKLHPNSLALLSDDEIAIATNKGWILS